MANARRPNQGQTDKSLPTLLQELWDLIKVYAKQETIEPIKSLGRYVAFGLVGSLLLGAGTVMLSLAGLRALQTETGSTFEGNWSFAPYLIVFAGCAVIIGLALSRTQRRGPGGDKK